MNWTSIFQYDLVLLVTSLVGWLLVREIRIWSNRPQQGLIFAVDLLATLCVIFFLVAVFGGILVIVTGK